MFRSERVKSKLESFLWRKEKKDTKNFNSNIETDINWSKKQNGSTKSTDRKQNQPTNRRHTKKQYRFNGNSPQFSCFFLFLYGNNGILKKLMKTADWFLRFSLNQLEEGAFGEIAQGYQTILSEIAFHLNSHKKVFSWSFTRPWSWVQVMLWVQQRVSWSWNFSFYGALPPEKLPNPRKYPPI